MPAEIKNISPHKTVDLFIFASSPKFAGEY
jgi:hypothetical protein